MAFTFERSITAGKPMTAEERSHAELLLARLVAAAYMADHPEVLGKGRAGFLEEEGLTARSQQHTLQASRDRQLLQTTGGP
jgi:hypothetical protein